MEQKALSTNGIAIWCCRKSIGLRQHQTLGALMAASQGYEPIFLDADNWFKPNHVELALALHRNDPSIDVVISSRTILLDEEARSILYLKTKNSTSQTHPHSAF